MPKKKWSRTNRKKPVGALCGARNRGNGLPCKMKAMPNGRCKYHGGMSTGPKNKKEHLKYSALKHGLYADVGLHREELSIYPHVKIGNLEEEIKILKMKLRRLWQLQKEWEEDQKKISEEVEGSKAGKVGKFTRKYFRVNSIEDSEGESLNVKTGKFEPTKSRKINRKKDDYMAEIRKVNKIIGTLEEKHKSLVSEGFGSEELLNKLVDSFRGFAEEAIGTLPGKKM